MLIEARRTTARYGRNDNVRERDLINPKATMSTVGTPWGIQHEARIQALIKQHAMAERGGRKPKKLIGKASRRGVERPVVRVDTGRQFGSMREAADAMGCDSGSLSTAMRRGRPLKGIWFRYADEAAPRVRQLKGKGNRKPRAGVPVIVDGAPAPFDSQGAAARWLGCDVRSIQQALRKGGTVKGVRVRKVAA